MATHIKLTLDKRRKKSDDTYPIVYKITHNRIPTTLKTNYCVEEAYWNPASLLIKKGAKSVKHISSVNLLLKSKEAEMMKIIIQLDEASQLDNMLVPELIAKLKQSELKTLNTFTSYSNRIIKDLKADNKIGNANAYRDAVNFLKNYSKGKDVNFSQINSKFLKMLENKYMSKDDNHYNGLSVYMRTIRAIYNRAITDGVANAQQYPFKQRASDSNKYQIKSEKTRKRAISKSLIHKFENFDPPSKSSHLLTDAKMYFLFSFFMRGINFIDMAHLKVRNIENGVLSFKRLKTSRMYEIKLNDKAIVVLDHYGLKMKKQKDYLFPIIKRTGSAERILKDIKNTNKSINRYLKVIAKAVGIEINLTMYVGRHSWATIADTAGVDRRIISKGLGHTDLKTTEIYIDDLISNDDLEAADDLITG